MRYLFKPKPRTTVRITETEKVFPVRRVYCVGKNYAAHVVEMGDNPKRTTPFFFAKPTDAVECEPDEVPYASATANLHHEVELVVAIDGCGRDLAADEATMLIYGLAVGVDLTRRDLQADAKKKGQPWVSAKSFDNSAPVSALTPVRWTEFGTHAAIRLSVNGEVRQDSTLSAMIWSVPELLANLSRLFVLQPGDLIFTGTPAGVGPLQRGDRVSARVEGLAGLAFTIV